MASPRGSGIGRSTRLISLIVGLLSWISPFTLDAYAPGLPYIAAELNASVSLTQVTLSAALLGLAAGQVVTGLLSDRIGRRPPLICGLSLFIVASLACMLAPSTSLLIAARFVQGCAAGSALSTSRAIGRDLFEGEALSDFYARLGAYIAMAPVVGPLLSGVLLSATDTWRSIFVMIGVVGALALTLVVFVLPETLPTRIRTHPAAVGASPGLGDEPDRLTSSLPVGEMAGARVPVVDGGEDEPIVSAGSRGSARPAGSLRTVLAEPATIVAAVVIACAAAMFVTVVGGGSFLLQDDYGMSAATFSLIYAGGSAGVMVSSLLGGKFSARWHPASVATFGMSGMLLAGLGSIVSIAAGAGALTVGMALMGVPVMYGFVAPSLMTVGMAAHRHSAGVASAVFGVASVGLGALIVPLIGVEVPGPLPMMSYMVVACGCIGLLVLIVARGILRSRVVWSRRG